MLYAQKCYVLAGLWTQNEFILNRNGEFRDRILKCTACFVYFV